MAEPAQNRHPEIEPDIRPRLGVIQGGAESTPDQGDLKSVENKVGASQADRTHGLRAIQGGGESTPETADLRDAEEENPLNYRHWNKEEKKKLSLSGRIIKRGGPTGLILALLGVGGIGIFGPSTMLVNLVSNLTERYDYQHTSMSIRSERMLAKRLSGDMTKGSCSTVKIACRYSRPSNRLLSAMSDSGFTAYKDGKPISKRLIGFPNAKPDTYRFADSTGKTHEIKAKDLKSAIKKNPEIARALANAYRVRYMGLSDKIAYSVLKKWGANKANKLSSAPSESDVKETLNKESAPDGDGKPSDREGVKNKFASDIEKDVNKAGKRAAKASEPVLVLGTMGCIAADTPSLISKTIRAYQLRYLIKYAMVFLAAADALKAGDATPEQVAAIGTILTAEIVKDNKVINKSALDSFGVKYALYGSTSTKGYTRNYKDFIPGGGSALNSITKVTENPSRAAACNAILSPEAQAVSAGITAGMAASGVGAPLAAAKIAVQGAIKTLGKLGAINLAIDHATPLIGLIIKTLPIDKILSALIKDTTKDIQGEDVGNALTAGTGALLGQTANAGGNMPLTQSQALAYNNLSTQIIAKETEYDRQTLSPFDASNPHTFMGTIATRLMPIYSNFSSFSGTLSNILSIPSFASSAILGKVHAAGDDKLKYSMCDDSNVKYNKVAADPFCNIEYGIPIEYLDEDPEDVLNAVSSDIDPDTGDPKEGSDLADWVAQCAGGELYQSGSCIIDSRKTARYALYITDSRILYGMDNGPEEEEGGDSTASEPGSPTTFTVASYNMCHESHGDTCQFANKQENLAKTIKGNSGIGNPALDIVGAQELSKDTQKALVSKTGYETFPLTKNLPSTNGKAILWDPAKFTMGESGWLKGVHGNGSNHGPDSDNDKFPWVQLTSKSGQSVYVLSMHNPLDQFADAKGGPFDRWDNAVKIREWAASKATGSNMVIITGDFNQRGKTDGGNPTAYCVFTKGGFMQHAKNMTSNRNKNKQCPSDNIPIDQIYASTNVSGLKATGWTHINAMGNKTGTDHSPAWVTYDIPGESRDIISGVSKDGWVWPVPSVTSLGTLGYGQSGSKGVHKGIDIGISGGAALGRDVVAAHDGTVGRIWGQDSRCGTYISIKATGTEYYAAYQHVAPDGIKVKVGDTVKAGQVIAKIGEQGGSTCGSPKFYHLHFSIESKPAIVSEYADPFPNGTVNPLSVLPRPK